MKEGIELTRETDKDTTPAQMGLVFDMKKLPVGMQLAIFGATQSNAYARRHEIIKPYDPIEPQPVSETKEYE